MLLLTLYTAAILQNPCGRGVCVVNDFVKYTTISAVESKLDSRAKMFVVINGLGAFQDDHINKITRSEFHFQAHMTPSSTERFEKKKFPTFPYDTL